MRRIPGLLTGLVLLACVDGFAAQEVKTDKERLQGTWKLVVAEVDGKPLSKAYHDKNWVVVVKGDEWLVYTGNDKDPDRYTTKLDSAAKPKQINWTDKEPEDEAKAETVGIYELTDDTLATCERRPGVKDRPKEFKASDRNTMVRVYKRVKANEAAKTDKDYMQGTWKLVSGELAGQVFPKRVLDKGWTLMVKGDEWLEYDDDGIDLQEGYKLNEAAKPKQIDRTDPATKDPAKAQTVGIYELAGDTLRTCDRKPGVKDRPTEFKSLDRETMVRVFKRVKPEDSGSGEEQAAVWTSNEIDRRWKCAGNLKQISWGFLQYAKENGGKFPAKLEVLMTDTDTSPGVFVCPSSRDHRAAGKTIEAVVADFGKKGHCSFVYLGAGMTTAVDRKAVVAYDKEGNHGAGMNVVYADGTVEWLPRVKMLKVLAELKAGVNPPKALRR